MSEHSRYRAGLWLPDEKPMYGAQPILGHPLTPTAAWIMNEGSGNKIYDIIGRNHGTFGAGASAPSWAPEGLGFDGGDYIDLGNGLKTFGTSGDITILAQVKTSASVDAIFTYGYDGYAYGRFGLFSNMLSVYDGAAYQMPSSNDALDGGHHQIGGVLSRSEGKARFYIDGVLKDTHNWNGYMEPESDNLVFIGVLATTSGKVRYLLGECNWIQNFNWALSASEIQQLYINPYCWLAHPMEAELMYVAPPVGLSIPVAMHHYEMLRAC